MLVPAYKFLLPSRAPHSLCQWRKLAMAQPLCLRKLNFSTEASKGALDPKIEDLDGVTLSSDIDQVVSKLQDVRLPHSSYTLEQMENETSGHHVPQGFTESFAYASVQTIRTAFDVVTGFSFLPHTDKLLLRRVVFLETVAAVPGMVGAMNRHLKSLRRMEQDYGWIHTLLEEAENERMHLMTSLLLLKPGVFMKIIVLLSQTFFTSFYATAYALSPLYCHRFVGYLEEEAFKTYTGILNRIDQGELPTFKMKAPIGACRYWRLPEDSTLREVFLAIRADENHHRIVNHTFASMHAHQINPFPPGF